MKTDYFLLRKSWSCSDQRYWKPPLLCEVPNGRHSSRIDGGVILVGEKLDEPCNAGGMQVQHCEFGMLRTFAICCMRSDRVETIST